MYNKNHFNYILHVFCFAISLVHYKDSVIYPEAFNLL